MLYYLHIVMSSFYVVLPSVVYSFDVVFYLLAMLHEMVFVLCDAMFYQGAAAAGSLCLYYIHLYYILNGCIVLCFIRVARTLFILYILLLYYNVYIYIKWLVLY